MMISSKELLDETGISRATLNNYIKRGLLPRPEIRTGAEAALGRARLGYFESDAIERIGQVQSLIRSGMTLDEICEQFGAEPDLSARISDSIEPSQAQGKRGQTSSGRMVLTTDFSLNQSTISLDQYDSPAYMVNNQFELIWWNDAAVNELLPACQALPGELEARAALKLLLAGPLNELAEEDQDLIAACHLIAASRRLSKDRLFDLILGVDPALRRRLDSIACRIEEPENDPVLCFPLSDFLGEGILGYEKLYASYFREGILFTYGRSDQESVIADVLQQRPKLISSLLRQRKPHITPMAVLVADLQESVSLCAELPAEEYFELVNQIWQLAEPVFRKYQGTYGKHAGDGMLYYFLPQPDSDYKLNAIKCALELKKLMAELTQRWQERKGWFNDLNLNIGLHEGREWFGAFHAGPHVEFTVLGDTVNQAARLSDFARGGSIWATKSMINQIASGDRKAIHFGVYRESDQGERRLVSQSYACINSLNGSAHEDNHKFRVIEMLPITEILGLSG